MANTFKRVFMNMLQEDMTSGEAFGGGGGTGGSFSNVDSYAPGDARVPHALGTVDPRKGKSKKKKKEKAKAKKKIDRKKKEKKIKERDVPLMGHPVMQTRNSGMTGPSNKGSFGFM